MNVKEVKETVKSVLTVYFEKDKTGKYIVPPERQRTIVLIGDPGVGKTEAVGQIAGELKVGFVEVHLSHHTRQSAIGLPRIVKKEFGEVSEEITEYTMSEILAEIHRNIEESGKDEGIIFVDEINTISPSLEPAMLAFLQKKEFGGKKLPKGYRIVAAGNEAVHNNSVREFDAVTLDRMMVFHVDADADIFLQYAKKKKMHPMIINFIKREPEMLNVFEKGDALGGLVTPRGWEDLSVILYGAERNDFILSSGVTSAIIKDEKISEKFMRFYNNTREGDGETIADKICDKGVKSKALITKCSHMSNEEKWELCGELVKITKKEAVKENEVFEKTVTNCLEFIDKVLGMQELSFYVNSIIRDKDTAASVYKMKSGVFAEYSGKVFFERPEAI